MPVDGKEAANLLLARLEQCKTSPTVLFWLKLRAENLRATELGDMLLRLCDELNVVHSPNPAFYNFVKEKTADLAPIAPDFFAVNSTKDKAVSDFREEFRRRFVVDGGGADPHMYMGALMPFCFQGLCAKEVDAKLAKSLFFVFAAPEDGMRKMLEVFRKGGYFFNGKSYVFSQIYEHRLGHAFAPTFFSPGIPPPADKEREDNRLAYPLLDWEVEEDKFQGRLTRDEIRALMCEFPTWFYKKMLALKLVDHDAYITGARSFLFVFRALF
jgi:hypothetical protein